MSNESVGDRSNGGLNDENGSVCDKNIPYVKVNSDNGESFVANVCGNDSTDNSKQTPSAGKENETIKGTNKVKHDKFPIWVKFTNVPMEAWSINGLSAIASSIGIPVIIDTMTANVCQNGFGRTEYARVLVVMYAKKKLKDQIEFQYRDKNQNMKRIKFIIVEYDWKPNVCTHCCVFEHECKQCTKRARTEEEIKEMQAAKQHEVRNNVAEFIRPTPRNGVDVRFVQGKKQYGKEGNSTSQVQYNRGQPKQQWTKKKDVMGKKDEADKGKTYEEEFLTLGSKEGRSKSQRKTQGENKNRIPTIEESKLWSRNMFECYKEQWEAKWKMNASFEEDVYGEFQNCMSKVVLEYRETI
ncbi:hypothetical protein CTI12_AA448490 [Artemisia annua]|uniref:Uncharacterized protein n=1 Tax=Artemisia annua TaxID=35608 RepID=A0A2U1LRC8_ARTAN|nr:hypothetical protein CTI12_AA448490 [Artemisia annua]